MSLMFKQMSKMLSKPFLLGLLLVPTMLLAKPKPPTIEQLAAFPRMASFSIAPDGRHVAALEARGEDIVIVVWKADALNQPPTVIGATRMKLASVQFIKNDLLAVTMWQPYDSRLERLTKTFVSKLLITDLEGRSWREPLPQERALSREAERVAALSRPTVLDSLPQDPDHILVVSDGLDSSGDVFRVNVRSNRAERILRADSKISGYTADLDGNVRARIRADVDPSGAFVAAEIRDGAGGAWVEHFRSYVRDRDINQVIGFTKDPNIALLRSNVGKDKATIYEYDIAARKKREVLFQHQVFDALSVVQSRHRGDVPVAFGEILGVTYRGPRGSDLHMTSARLQAVERIVRSALGIRPQPLRLVDPETGRSVDVEYDTNMGYDIVSAALDFSSLVLRVDGDSRPPEYYLLRGDRLSLLARSFPDIDRASLGETRLVYYKARDGLDIPALLTTPNRDLCGPAPWPAVVHPHGGPWARDDLGFDVSMWVPLMVSRCFSVLRPQFRGSDGWGRRLWKAGDAEWGQKMQDDKDDGAAWLVSEGLAQRARIAIFGFSYGGYAAMVGAVRPGTPYRCAIAGAGVSDHRRIWASFYTNPFFRERQAPTVAGLNPIDFADKLLIPILVYHGDRDQVVPVEQSEWFVNKARSGAVPVAYRLFQDYGHGPAWTRKTFGDQLALIEDYLLRGCGLGGP